MHIGQNGDGAASAGRHRLYPIDLCHGARGRLVGLRRNGNEEPVPTLAGSHFHLYALGGNGLEMLLEKRRYLTGALIGDQPHGNLGMGRGRKDGLGARSGITAPDTAYVQAGTDARTLQGGVPFLSANIVNIQKLFIFF